MSGPLWRPTGRAENANHSPLGEKAADWPTTTTSLAIARMASAVGAGVPVGMGETLGGGGESAGLAGGLDCGFVGRLEGGIGVAVAGGTVGVADAAAPETGTT